MQVSPPSGNRRLLKRAAVATAWCSNPDATPGSIARAAGTSHSLAKRWKPGPAGEIQLTDAPRSGRKRKLDAADLHTAKALASQPAIHGSKRVARAMQGEAGVSVSARTVRRNFREEGLVYAWPKTETLMTKKHKSDRVAWCQQKLDEKFDWGEVMMTDSKIFTRQMTVAKRGRKVWQDARHRVTEERVRASEAVHVYGGVSAYAATPLLSVTCGAGQKNTTYRNARTRDFHKGVGGEEYSTDVLPWLKTEGDKIFEKYGECGGAWKFMQDGARPHTAAVSKQKLQKLWGPKRLLDWPANSPDLNVMENLWALLESKLDAKRAHIHTLEQLTSELNNICRKLRKDTFKNMFKGMPDRLRKVIELGGARIGK